MSKTIDFINNKTEELQKQINVLGLKRARYLTDLNLCDAEIMEKENSILLLTKELEKVRISDADLETIKDKDKNAKPNAIL